MCYYTNALLYKCVIIALSSTGSSESRSKSNQRLHGQCCRRSVLQLSISYLIRSANKSAVCKSVLRELSASPPVIAPLDPVSDTHTEQNVKKFALISSMHVMAPLDPVSDTHTIQNVKTFALINSLHVSSGLILFLLLFHCILCQTQIHCKI
jgi:hypothetical protein